MGKCINKVREIDVATVAGNKTLAAAVDRRAVERCKEAINKLGIVHTPVVGTAEGGRRLLLSGQSELTALRELGVKKMDAIEVDMAGSGGSAKLSLLLISLRDKPGALCEGLLLKEAVNSGVPRSEIQSMLGKSASWVSNRLSLVTRLDGNVYEMVKSGLLEARSAQEVARLPAESQFTFAEAAVREGLPKSAIESLVAGYNDGNCPGAVKAQILREPREALKRMIDKRRAVYTCGQGPHNENAAPDAVNKLIKAMSMQVAEFCYLLLKDLPPEPGCYRGALMELERELLIFLMKVKKLVSLGKMGVGQSG
jgi:ParB-like chromosome segregation protein Spo0J